MNSEGEYIYSYKYQVLELGRLSAEYPFIKTACIGRSRLGRGIYGVYIGEQNAPVLYAGGFHGCEWLTCMCLLRFIERVAACVKSGDFLCDADISEVLKISGICVVPCVNPDGVEIAIGGAQTAKQRSAEVERIMQENPGVLWSANAAGVDINHNFNAGREQLLKLEHENGITRPSPTRFCGPFAESEPETRTMTSLCRKHHFRQLMALHSQGEEIFWRYDENTPFEAHAMAKILASCSGYKLVENTGLASHGGFKDWFITEMHKPGFTVEIGKGKNPLPESMLDDIYNTIEEMLTMFMLM